MPHTAEWIHLIVDHYKKVLSKEFTYHFWLYILSYHPCGSP